MTSFQITLTPSRRAAARFVTEVRRALQKALAEEKIQRGLTQSEISRSIDVDRSIISRQLRGYKDMSLGRVAEFAFAMGREPQFLLPEQHQRGGANTSLQMTDSVTQSTPKQKTRVCRKDTQGPTVTSTSTE